ncbi:GNAT family N-acetyltransferase [Sphingomonas sp. IW22]|uniref:GNAT family N-acetyltransferase n=1 Tax=Sphingomonas sp. IW22 TaxID=3242489 RepID=UPI003521DF70
MIRTERLLLRQPQASDLDALHQLWSNPKVMAQLGPVKDRRESQETFARHCGYWKSGFGFWIVECGGGTAGFCGLKPGAPNTPIAGEIEAGWILGPEWWGRGLANEAMAAALEWGWAHLRPSRIVAITSAGNVASRRLMVRLGMSEVADGAFDHPLFAVDDPRRATVTYAIAESGGDPAR